MTPLKQIAIERSAGNYIDSFAAFSQYLLTEAGVSKIP